MPDWPKYEARGWSSEERVTDTEHAYQPHGAALKAWYCQRPVVCMHGPAGTGKSLAWGNILYRDALAYPGSRQLILRQTRASLSESFLNTWETKVLWPEHPLLQRGAQRAYRQSYQFPNGSVVVTAGMDIPTRIFSAEYDRVYVNECNELSRTDWWSLVRCLRNGVMPYQQLCGDTNPDDSAHHLYQNMLRGKIYGIQSYHEDNPMLSDPAFEGYDPTYLPKLRNLEGVLYDRLYLGLWVAAEGLAFPQYNRERHVVDRMEQHEGHRGGLAPDGFYRDEDGGLEFIDYFAAMDFGWTSPGAMGIFGVDQDRRVFLIHEVYASGKQLDWWAEWLECYCAMYAISSVTADSAEPRSIEYLNDRLGHQGGRRGMGQLVMPAEKDARAQKDLLRWSLKSDVDGLARLFILADSLEEPYGFCGEEDEVGVVQGLAHELPTLKLRQPTPMDPKPDQYDPKCRDHATDMTCYGLSTFFDVQYARARQGELYAPGSMGHQFGHARILGLDGRPRRDLRGSG